MSDNVLEIVIQARDEATRVLEQFEKKADDSAKNVESAFAQMQKGVLVAASVFAAAGAAIGLAINDFANKAGEAEVETVKMDATLKNVAEQMKYTTVTIKGNSGEIKKNKDELTKQASALRLKTLELKASGGEHKSEMEAIQKSTNELRLHAAQLDQTSVVRDRTIQVVNKNALSFDQLRTEVEKVSSSMVKLGFDDEEAANALASSLQVTNDLTMSKQALAAAADLARYKGIGLTDATNAMNMAMQGGGKVLKQLGIEVADNATKQQILEAVMKKVQGQAEAYGNTYVGAQERMKVSTDNIKESLGSGFLPVFTNFTNKISEYVATDQFQSHIENISKSIEDAMSGIEEFTKSAQFKEMAADASDLQVAFKNVGQAANDLLLTMNGGSGGTAMAALLNSAGTSFYGVAWIVDSTATGFALLNLEIQKFLNLIGNGILKVADYQTELERINLQHDQIMLNYQTRSADTMTAVNLLWGEHQVKTEQVMSTMDSGTTAHFSAINSSIATKTTEAKNTSATNFSQMQTGATQSMTTMQNNVSTQSNLMSTNYAASIASVKSKSAEFEADTSSKTSSISGKYLNMVSSINNALRSIKFPHVSIGEGSTTIAGKDIKYPSLNVDWYEKGGPVRETGLAMVHQGEFVLSKDMLSGKSSVPSSVSQFTNSSPISVTQYVNSEVDIDRFAYELAYALDNRGRY